MRLRRVLEHLLATVGAGALGGCCDLTGSGRYPDFVKHDLVWPPPGVVQAAREGPDGRLDDATCAAVHCEPSCRFATSRISWTPRPGIVRCQDPLQPRKPTATPRCGDVGGVECARDPHVYERPIPAHLRPPSGKDLRTGMERGTAELCASACDRGVELCEIRWPDPAPPPPDQRFIVCTIHETGQCPDRFRIP